MGIDRPADRGLSRSHRGFTHWVLVASLFIGSLGWLGAVGPKAAGATSLESEPQKKPVKVLRLSLDEAIAIFLRQNLEVIIANFGIGSAKAMEITAALFPNPEFSLEALSSFTQGCDASDCGAVTPGLSQLLIVAGKRGFRIESAAYGRQAAEANFEDTIRQLTFAVKDAYFQTQAARGHRAVDRERLAAVTRLLRDVSSHPERQFPQQQRLRLRLRAMLLETEIIRDIQDIDVASGDLRVLLGLSPDTELSLTTKLEYKRVDPDLAILRRLALEQRPDIRARHLVHLKRKAELKLARALQYPDVTVGLDYTIQGPEGPANPQQWGLNLRAPIPVFDRNQGGITKASVALQAAEAEYRRRRILVQNEIDVAYRHFVQSRKLVEEYRTGILERARSLFDFVMRAYENSDIGLLVLMDSGRASKDIEEEYIDALYGYQRDLLLLERAVGRDLAS